MFNNIVIYYTIFFEFGARRPQRTLAEKYPKITGDHINKLVRQSLVFSKTYLKKKYCACIENII